MLTIACFYPSDRISTSKNLSHNQLCSPVLKGKLRHIGTHISLNHAPARQEWLGAFHQQEIGARFSLRRQ